MGYLFATETNSEVQPVTFVLYKSIQFAEAWSVRTQDLSNGHGRYIILKSCQGPCE
jgi:hypothetical protein